jgi:hypothetical protein
VPSLLRAQDGAVAGTVKSQSRAAAGAAHAQIFELSNRVAIMC